MDDRTADPNDGDLIDAAFEAIEQDDPERAMKLAAKVSEDEPLRYVIAAAAYLRVDDIEAAREAIDQADELELPLDDLDGLWTRSDLLLREWKIAEAEACFERILTLEESAVVCDRLAFCAELRHDRARADRFLARAAELDPDDFSIPPRLTDGEFWDEIDAAITILPPQFREILEGCTIQVIPVPTIEIARAGNPAEVAPDTLGLFTGPSLMERGFDGPPELPPIIYLFQRNLERMARDEEELVEEIRVTLYHELGHMLGFDEEGVDRMGLG